VTRHNVNVICGGSATQMPKASTEQADGLRHRQASRSHDGAPPLAREKTEDVGGDLAFRGLSYTGPCRPETGEAKRGRVWSAANQAGVFLPSIVSYSEKTWIEQGTGCRLKPPAPVGAAHVSDVGAVRLRGWSVSTRHRIRSRRPPAVGLHDQRAPVKAVCTENSSELMT
jgi:hypothetical protein